MSRSAGGDSGGPEREGSVLRRHGVVGDGGVDEGIQFEGPWLSVCVCVCVLCAGWISAATQVRGRESAFVYRLLEW